MNREVTTKWTLGLSTTAALAIVAFGVAACDPVPRRTLSTEEKIADLYWIYSQFGENYAPLEYKQKRFNFNYESIKQQYLEDAKKTTTNDEFYALMLKFVAEFKDAHTSAALTNGSLPDRAKVAFLGFSGIRTADDLLVKSVLPTNAAKSNYPVKVGDLITAVNDRTLKEIVDSDLTKYRDTGFSEANYTYHFNKIFSRVSTSSALPKEAEVTLTVKRAGKTLKITMPWVVKDVVTFQEEQEKAAPKKQATPSDDPEDESTKPQFAGNYLMLSDDMKSQIMKFSFIGFDGRMEMPLDVIRRMTAGLKFKITNTFRLPDFISEWQVATTAAKTAEKAPLDRLADLRKVLDDAIYISGSTSFPSYVAPVSVVDKDGKKTSDKKLVGYVYIDTFSPSGSSDDVVKEFKNTLASFKNLGVRDIVIDTINNGGGSLELGMKLAQSLTPDPIKQPQMQFRLSDTWLDEFQTAALSGTDEATKEYSRRVYADLVSAKQAGQRLSQPYSADILYRYTIQPNADLDSAFRVKLLVNEMCASMCDMFAGIIQDNKLGEVVGTRTMGAGGNVVNHMQAPNSHIEVRQTESLMIRADGSYVENNGVTPDLVVEVVKSAKDKYAEVINKAVERIVKKTE